MTEHEIQREAVKQLRKLGFIVAVTSDSRKARTRGVADIYVNIHENHWIAADCKSETGEPTPEQLIAWQDKRLYIFRDVVSIIEYCIKERKCKFQNTNPIETSAYLRRQKVKPVPGVGLKTGR
jgi:hypothetical protein